MQKLTAKAGLVEINAPTAPVLARNEYRAGVFGPSSDLSGATQQLLHDRDSLEQEYMSLALGGMIFRPSALADVSG
jgi:hypothetical protein